MWYRLSADFVLLIHLAFVLFVVAGGLLVLKWPRLAWLHLPAVAWGALVEFTGWICPLTPLENSLRAMGGGAVYGSDFIAHYLLPILYPTGLTRYLQVVLGMGLLAANVALYVWLWRRRKVRMGVTRSARCWRKT
ncbi:MAG: putative membrane protein [Nitrospira sp.]|nr:MAG: putative membrane protein [Nitrospira sp.]